MSLREQICQIYENYPYSMPTCLQILILVLGTLMIDAKITILFYRKYTIHQIVPRPHLYLT